MELLLLGGSWSLGRRIAEESADRGFGVTVFGGQRAASLPAVVRHVQGNRMLHEDLRRLAGFGPWDIVVDISGKIPAVVRDSARVLARCAGRYVSVSTVSVYRDWPDQPVDEDSPLRAGDPGFDPGTRTWAPEVYASMKAGCELACREAFSDDRLLILRLQTIIGQHEDDGPLLWWLNRMRRGGPVLAPSPDRAIQPVDFRDVARFVVDLAGQGCAGVFNVAAPADGRSYGSLLQACAQVVAAGAAAPPELVWADEKWLLDAGVRPWTELPLWHAGAAHWEVSADRALAAGLRCRPLAATAAATWQWQTSRHQQTVDHERLARYGMDPVREAEIIARWRAKDRR